MVKDKRYKTVKILIETENISQFKEIFDHIPKTKVSTDLGIGFERMEGLINTVRNIRVGDIFLFSEYFEVDAKTIFLLIYNQKQNSGGGRNKGGAKKGK